MLVINQGVHPVTLWNDDAFVYEDEKTYLMLVTFMAEGGHAEAGPDFGGKGGLNIQLLNSSGDVPSDYKWHYIYRLFTVDHFALARPYVIFWGGLGGKVRYINIREVSSGDHISVPGTQEMEDLIIADPDLFLLITQPPVSRITLSPGDLKTPGLVKPDIQRVPTPSPARRVP